MHKTRSRITCILLLTVSFSFLVMPNAHAYVDPASGSYVFQVLIGVFVGVGFAIKIFWRKIVGIFYRLFSREHDAAR
jgi:hypothetical protein